MYTWKIKPDRTIGHVKDLGKAPVKIGDRVTADRICMSDWANTGDNPANYVPSFSFHGDVIDVKPTPRGFYELTVKGSLLGPNSGSKQGCITINTEYDKKQGNMDFCVRSLDKNTVYGCPSSLNEQSFEDYSTDMESETQSNDINLQEQLLFIIEHLDGGHTEDVNVTPEKMVEVLKETIKQFVNPNDSITVRDWEKLYYSITNDMYA
jgi:hypothetical protein